MKRAFLKNMSHTSKHYAGTLLLIVFCLASACDGLEDSPPVAFEVSVDSVGAREARLSWPIHEGLSDDFVVYTVVVDEDTVMVESRDSITYLKNLAPGTTYSGTVIATELAGSSTPSYFTFKTLSELYFNESFNNAQEWVFTISKNSADTRTSATLGPDGLTLLAGTGPQYTDFGAQATATKEVKELNLLSIAKLKEIKINAEFNLFALVTLASPNFHVMDYKLGPYSVVISTKLPHSSTPPVKRFEITISIPDGNVHAAKAMMKVYYLTGGNFQREIYWRNAEFDIYLDKFQYTPIISFSARTGNNDGPVYPLYSNKFILQSLEIIATGERP